MWIGLTAQREYIPNLTTRNCPCTVKGNEGTVKYVGVRVNYYSNSVASFRSTLLQAGDINPNPGPIVPESGATHPPSSNCTTQRATGNNEICYKYSVDDLLKLDTSSSLIQPTRQIWNIIDDLGIARRRRTHRGRRRHADRLPSRDELLPSQAEILPSLVEPPPPPPSPVGSMDGPQLVPAASPDTPETASLGIEPPSQAKPHDQFNHSLPHSETVKQNIQLYSFNARSIRNKTVSLQSYLQTNPVDVISISETWLDDDFNSCELGLPDDYCIFRNDRANTRGGGVLISVRSYLLPQRLPDLETPDIEMVICEITLKKKMKWIVCSVYRPPNSKAEFFDKLETVVDSVQNLSRKYQGIVFVGDFNVNWKDENCRNRDRLLQIFETMNMTQCVTDVTRPQLDDPSKGSIIDLVFVNRPELCQSINVTSNCVISDHHAVLITFHTVTPQLPKSIIRKFLCYQKGDYEHLNNLLRLAPWDLFMNHNDVDESWEGFLDLYQAAINDCIPHKVQNKKQFCPWVTPQIKRLTNKAKKLFVSAKSHFEDEEDVRNEWWDKYKRARNHAKQESNKSYWRYLNGLFSMHDNRKRFFGYMRSLRRNPTPPIISDQDNVLNKPEEIANCFSDYFVSVFNQSDPDNVPELPSACDFPIAPLNTLDFPTCEIVKLIDNLSLNKSPGIDGITAVILKKVKEPISIVLQRMFQISLSLGQLPKQWKQSIVIPVHKSGNPSDFRNYRPVALTSVVCKMMETFVDKCIVAHVESYGLLSPKQHGFTPKRSCVTQVLNITHDWFSSLDVTPTPLIDAIFLDFSKAFDRMPHDLLLNKLAKKYNIQSNVWEWVSSFVCGREQTVQFRGSRSDWSIVTSGIPQGSVLGPRLFNLFVNDITHVVQSKCVLFADDTLLYRIIRNETDMQMLQADITHVINWCSINKMQLNATKTKVLRIAPRKRNVEKTKYTIDDNTIEQVNSIKYLGITLNSSLTWDDQVNNVIKKANRMLGLISRLGRGVSQQALLCLYKSLVLPILEYGVPSWYVYTRKHVEALERVQRRATRLILKQRRQEMPYPQRLQNLAWFTLESRRKYLLISFVIKTLYGIVWCEAVNENVAIRPRQSEHTILFQHLRARTERLHQTAVHRFPIIWESLPSHVKDEIVSGNISKLLTLLRQEIFSVL